GGRALPFAFDLLARDCEGNPALDESRYPRPSDALEMLLTSQTLYIGGTSVEAAAADAPVPLFAPDSWTSGSSYSHFDETTFPNMNAQSLMTPFFTSGERILSPGALTCAVLGDMGWELGPGCNALVQQQSPVVVDIGGDACAGTNPPDPNPTPPTTPPAPEIFTLDALSPTVLVPSQGTSTIRFTVTFGTDTNLDVFLYDTLGQLHLTRRFAGAAETEVVDVPIELGGLDLASGAYFVAFQSGGRQQVKRITVVR
ncbi:MAG: T9SS type A sorting domain-containing protein, partial [Bacteroidota bacterium]